MEISETSWLNYINKLRKVNDAATEKMLAYLAERGIPGTQAEMNSLIDYAFAIATRYGEAAAELAASMFDSIAVASKKILPAAVPAPTPDISEVAKAIVGTAKTENMEIISAAVGRLVKRTGVDTTMNNAIKYGAQWAWIPHGDTCAFCLTLASRGWQRASKAALKGGHAEHIHANCDCTYAIRFDGDTNVKGYNPQEYLDMYYGADGNTPTERINAMRREFYAENKERINEQKRSAYAKRKELESSKAEEIDV